MAQEPRCQDYNLEALHLAASPADLPGDYWPDDGELPCSRSVGEGRCDSAEFRLVSSCTVDPILATVIRDQPTGPINKGPEESFQLQAHVSSHAYTFAYRWTVFHSDDTMMLWPVVLPQWELQHWKNNGISLISCRLTLSQARQTLRAPFVKPFKD